MFDEKLEEIQSFTVRYIKTIAMDIIVVLVAIAYIFYQMVGLKVTDTNPLVLIAQAFMGIICGVAIKQALGENGYLRVEMSKNGIHKLNLIHRLVAQAFIPNINNYREINHINCNKSDNRIENLEWVSSSQNKIHAIENKLYKIEKQILQIKNGIVIKEWKSATQVYKELGYLPQNIGKVALGKRKSAYGYQWRFK